MCKENVKKVVISILTVIMLLISLRENAFASELDMEMMDIDTEEVNLEDVEQSVLEASESAGTVSTFVDGTDDGVADEIEVRNGIVYSYVSTSDTYEVSDCDASVVNADVLEKVEGKLVTRITHKAFNDSDKLISVSIPASVNAGLEVPRGQPGPFSNSVNVTRIDVSDNNKTYCSVDGVVYTKDKQEVLFCPHGKTGEYVISSGVVKVKREAFAYCKKLTKIVIPEGLTVIEDYAFYTCTNLVFLNIPDTVKRIGKRAFYSCNRLQRMHISNSMTEIEEYAFDEMLGLESVSIPGNVKKIGHYAFRGCSNIKEIILSEGIEIIAYNAFQNCSSIQTLTIPESVTVIGKSNGCVSLSSIVVNSENKILESRNGILFNWERKRIVWVSQAMIINRYEVPEGIVSIGDAFSECLNLVSISLPQSLEEFNYNGRDSSDESTYSLEVSSLDSIDIAEGNPFYKNYKGGVYTKDMRKFVICPKAKKNIVIFKGTETISAGAFSECNNLTTVVIPDGVKEIENHAFYRCRNLTTVFISDGVTSIDRIHIFSNCEKLRNVVIPDSVTHIRPVSEIFWDSPNVTICCNPGSYAEQYAKENGIKYGPMLKHIHSYEKEITKKPTCIEKGLFTYSCQECEDSYTEEIPMIPHTYEKITQEDGKIIEKCSVCGKINSSDATEENSTENVGIEEKKIDVISVKLSAPSSKLAAGRKVKLTARILPDNATNKLLKWSTSNKKYATVDQKGNVYLKSAGAGKKVTITAVSQDGSEKKASCKITIMKHAVKNIKIKASTKTIKAGRSLQLKPVIKTSGKKANKNLAWSSSNTKYATVDKKGKVRTKKAGKGKYVKITAQSTDGTAKKAVIKLKIK